MYDLVSFGEVMLRLAAPGWQRLEQAVSLDIFVGGTELNVAIGAGRLGLRTAYVTRLTDNALGRMVRNKVREQGVDASRIAWTGNDRVGLYFTEAGTNPRGGDLIYDRADSAVSKIAPGEIDWESIFRNARHYHVTGITAALSESAAAVTRESMVAAKAAGCTVSFDVNYRAKLWTEAEAKACLEPLLEHVDILFTSVGEVKNVFGIAGRDAAETAAKIEKAYGIPVIGLMQSTRHSVLRITWRTIAYERGKVYEDIPIEIEIADRIGGGDAFAAGFLYAYLTREGNVAEALRYGNATAALKYTNPGDFSWSTLAEVEGLIRGRGGLAMKR